MSEPPKVIRFPQSRVPGRSRNQPIKELGATELARAIDPEGKQLKGHWCSRCQGIWYGLGQEVACPACGNRHG